MKTPEEIKHALECCKESECHYCPYCLHESDVECNGEMAKDALHLINLLDSDVKFYQHLYNIQDKTIECHEQYEKQLEKRLDKVGKTCQEWISVEDKLPEEAGIVIMLICGISAPAFYLSNGKFKSWNGYLHEAGNAVTHWMPLPEPPKEVYHAAD